MRSDPEYPRSKLACTRWVYKPVVIINLKIRSKKKIWFTIGFGFAFQAPCVLTFLKRVSKLYVVRVKLNVKYRLKAGVYLHEGFLTSLNMAFLQLTPIPSAYSINQCFPAPCKIFRWLWVGGKRDFFLKGQVKLKKIWNFEDLTGTENWNLRWRISRCPRSSTNLVLSPYFFSFLSFFLEGGRGVQ